MRRPGADLDDAEKTPRPLRMAELSARSGVPRETIHFYLREGLLPRPRKGGRTVAYYGEEHLERLRTIRRLREEKYLPLAVIRRLLDAPGAPAERDVDVLAEVLHILPLDDDAGPEPSPAAVREAAARGLLGSRPAPGAAGSDPAERRVLGLVDEALAQGDPARSLTLADLEACASGLEGLVAREAAIFFDALLQSGDLEGSISALRSGRSTVARFITAFRDLMLRRVLEELLLAVQQGHAAVMRAAVPPLPRARRDELGEPARRAALVAAAESGDADASAVLVAHLFGCADGAALAAVSPAILARAGSRTAPLAAWGAHEAAPSDATLAALDRAVAAAPDLPLGPILLAGATLARGVRRRDDDGPSLLEEVVPALQRLAAAEPESEPDPALRALGHFHLGWVELALPAVLGRRARGAAALARSITIAREFAGVIDPAVVATIVESAERRG
jgi:DNA-binding transcriptional MerR regulator